MPRIIGKAGHSVRRMEFHHYRIRVLIIIVAILGMLVLLRFYTQVGMKVKGTAALIFVGVFIGIIKIVEAFVDNADKHHRKRERNARRGATGEEKIGAILAALSDEYVVIHDLECPNGNIDHVVIGPNGVFQIETKAHGGKVHVENGTLLVNGKPPEKDFIRQAQRNSMWLKEQIRTKAGLNLRVTALLVFANAFTTGDRRIQHVCVCNARSLAHYLNRPSKTVIPVDDVVAAVIPSVDEMPLLEKETGTEPNTTNATPAL